jgi:hypothetical protein
MWRGGLGAAYLKSLPASCESCAKNATPLVTTLMGYQYPLFSVFVSKTGELKPFEASLRVKIARPVPVQTELAPVRKPRKGCVGPTSSLGEKWTGYDGTWTICSCWQ